DASRQHLAVSRVCWQNSKILWASEARHVSRYLTVGTQQKSIVRMLRERGNLVAGCWSDARPSRNAAPRPLPRDKHSLSRWQPDRTARPDFSSVWTILLPTLSCCRRFARGFLARSVGCDFHPAPCPGRSRTRSG